MNQNMLQQQFVNDIPSLYPGASASYFDFGAALMMVSCPQSPLKIAVACRMFATCITPWISIGSLPQNTIIDDRKLA